MAKGLQVYSEPCENCLLSKDRIVSPKKAKKIIEDCKRTQRYFVCHKASINNEEVVCSTFYNTLGGISQGIRMAQILDVVEFIDQPNLKKLPTYNEMYQE